MRSSVQSGCLVVVQQSETKTGQTIMCYIYILQSIPASDHFYVGYTIDLEKRLIEHNSGESVHTNEFKP